MSTSKMRKRCRAKRHGTSGTEAAAGIYWHYTIGDHLRLIEADGYIKPATAFVAIDERPIVWFSKYPFWEPTANKLFVKSDGATLALDMEQTRQCGHGLYRIGVAAEHLPYDWPQLVQHSGMDKKIAKALEEIALRAGTRASYWRGTFDCVPRGQWSTIEALVGDDWIPVPKSDWLLDEAIPDTEPNILDPRLRQPAA